MQVLLKLACVLKKLVRVLQEVVRMLTEVGPSVSPHDAHSGLLIDSAGAQGTSLPFCPISLAEKFLEMARFVVAVVLLLFLCFETVFVCVVLNILELTI